MQIFEISRVVTADLPSAELADYLQLQADMTGTVRQNQHLDSSLRAAIFEIETRTGRALLLKEMEVVVEKTSKINLEFGRADNVQILNVFAGVDEQIDIANSDYVFEAETHNCSLNLKTAIHSQNWGAKLKVGKEHWDEVQSDLQMAVLTLAAHYYVNRFEPTKQNSGIPKLVDTLIEKHRRFRLLRR